jgi:hypothetical protein
VKNGILGRSRSAGSRRNRFYRPFDAIRFRAVKNGILGRSRSAGSRRNRFYRPFDAIRFRALNALSPDTTDSPDRGTLFANFYNANHNSVAAASWESMINNVPGGEGSSCDGSAGGHGIDGCGANIVIAVADTLANANWFNQTQTWVNVADDTVDARGASYMVWNYVCNYNCSTYPPVL